MSDYKTMLAEKLMNEYGISKQQAQSKVVDCFAEMLKDTSDFYQAYKESGIDTVVNDMNEKLQKMNEFYDQLVKKYNYVQTAYERFMNLFEESRNFQSSISMLSGKQKQAVVMYKEILKTAKNMFNISGNGDEKEVMRSASYIVWATLMGENETRENETSENDKKPDSIDIDLSKNVLTKNFDELSANDFLVLIEMLRKRCRDANRKCNKCGLKGICREANGSYFSSPLNYDPDELKGLIEAFREENR